MSGYLWRGRPGLEDANAAIMRARTPGQTPDRIGTFDWNDHRRAQPRLRDRRKPAQPQTAAAATTDTDGTAEGVTAR